MFWASSGDTAIGEVPTSALEAPAHTLAIQPVQQIAYVPGKGATDIALVIDAMDLLYSGQVDTFCLVASDSDYTRLAMRLREAGKRVVGIGAKQTPAAFSSACDRFTFVEVLEAAAAPFKGLDCCLPRPLPMAPPLARCRNRLRRRLMHPNSTKC